MPPHTPDSHRRGLSVLLNAALNANRQGQLRALTVRHQRLARLLEVGWLSPVLGGLGDYPPESRRVATAYRVLLEWALAQLRPDKLGLLGDIDERAWFYSTSWRPFLALGCQHGLLAVPDFPERYRRRADESVIDNLCGLWAIGPSTLYRYLDKGRRQLAELFDTARCSGTQDLDLRIAAQKWLEASPEPVEGWMAWHGRQARQALRSDAVTDGLWHLWQANDLNALLDALHRFALQAASTDATDALLARVESSPALTDPWRFELALRWAVLWRHRQAPAKEEEALQLALRLAKEGNNLLQLGLAHTALARFRETHDVDRAQAAYEEAAELLRQALPSSPPGEHEAVVRAYATALVRLAWIHLRRNNPRAQTLLGLVERLSSETPLPDDTLGLFEQTRGEYWRCVNEPRRASEHMQRALLVFERIGDQRSVLNTYRNLSLLYAELREHDRAVEYGQKVLVAAKGSAVEPEVMAGTLGNLGISFFYQGDFDQAIAQYEQALALQERQGLRAQVSVSHYNLAEAYYRRFQLHGVSADEQRGDFHAAAAARTSAEINAPRAAEAAQTLKREVLGMGDSPDRLLPQEFADHYDEMATIQQQRTALAAPQTAEQQVRSHLAIARAYLSIAGKEREAALAIAQRHALAVDFTEEVAQLRSVFERELTREQQLRERWRAVGLGILTEQQRQDVLKHVLEQGAINKSSYADVAGVSPATASKHLSLLLERGLLTQVGKGPSTRYLLPDEPA